MNRRKTDVLNLDELKNSHTRVSSRRYQIYRLLLSKGATQITVSTSWLSSVTQLCLPLCDPMDCSMPGFPVHHHLPEFAQTHVHRVSDAIQPSRPLSSPSPPAPSPSWSPLGWTGWTSLQSKGLSRVFSNTTVQKHQFFSAQPSSQSNSHFHTWPQEKP